MADVDSAGLARIKNRASDRRRMHFVFGYIFLLSQIVRTNGNPFNGLVVLTDDSPQVISSFFIIRMGWQEQTDKSNKAFLTRGYRLLEFAVAVARRIH